MFKLMCTFSFETSGRGTCRKEKQKDTGGGRTTMFSVKFESVLERSNQTNQQEIKQINLVLSNTFQLAQTWNRNEDASSTNGKFPPL